MKNRSDKTRDMARSVLPSTRRRQTRHEKRRINQRERARVKAALHSVRVAAHPDDVDANLEWVDRSSRKHMVWERRAADKVAPLIRWAEARVAADPALTDASLEDAMVYFAQLLPPDVIGRHALSHLRFVLDPDRWDRRRYAQNRAARAAAERVELRDALETILRLGAHKEFNAWVKVVTPTGMFRPLWSKEYTEARRSEARRSAVRGSWQGWCTLRVPFETVEPPRVLDGFHDLDDFADHAATEPRVSEVTLRFADELRARRR